MHTPNGLPSSILDISLTLLNTNIKHTKKLSRLGSPRWVATAVQLRQTQVDTEKLPPPPPPVSFVHRKTQGRSARLPILFSPPPQKPAPNSKPSKEKNTQLSARIQSLQVAAEAENKKTSANIESESLSYSEEELELFYHDVLSTSSPNSNRNSNVAPTASAELHDQADPKKIMILNERKVLQTAYQRLTTYTHAYVDVENGNGEGLSEPNSRRASPNSDSSLPLYKRVLWHAERVAERFEGLSSPVSQPNKEGGGVSVPVSVLSVPEWEAVVNASLRARDGGSAERSLQVMQTLHIPIPNTLLTSLLTHLSHTANIPAFERCLTTFTDQQQPPPPLYRKLHLVTYLKSHTTPGTIPINALTLLHSYEHQNAPAPMSAYTHVISNLLSIPSSTARAHAWDLFSHMRYVAHPRPDERLYAIMIRACASSASPSSSAPGAEVALDLWHELTTGGEPGFTPCLKSYNSIILACARSEKRVYINEAFRIAKQMFASPTSVLRGTGTGGDSESRYYVPDAKTFEALMEGAKRLGDLGRARWILAEMVRCGEMVVVGGETMMHVFHAYASYRPPFVRRLAKVVVGRDADADEGDVREGSSSSDLTDGAVPSSVALETGTGTDEPTFSHIPPRTSSEVLSEASTLFTQITAPNPNRDPTSTSQLKPKLPHIRLTPRLLNSYLSVHYAHNSLSACRSLFYSLFDKYEVEKTERTYLEALKVCAYVGKGERGTAVEFASKLFGEWKEMEESALRGGKRVDARNVEQVYALYIRVLAASNELDNALSVLRTFVTLYPPSSLRSPQAQSGIPPFRSTRTSLYASRPLVRMSSATSVPDDTVPPMLGFRDLEILHHRLVAEGRERREVGYVKWVCKSYEWMLRVRRDEGMRARASEG